MGLNLGNGEFIAVKCIDVLGGAESKEWNQLQIEIQVMKKLQHPNIVKYLGSKIDEGMCIIFQEYVPGGSLLNVVEKFGSLPESVVRIYTKQILVAVDVLHSHSIVHRDIKPANILLDDKGHIKLADFGACKHLLEKTGRIDMDSMHGTPLYMAPEVIQQTNAGRKSDIWSLGCTVLQLVTGHHPWHHLGNVNAAALLYRIASKEETPVIPQDASEELRDFLTICFTRNPDLRMSAQELLSHAFVLGTTLAPKEMQSSQEEEEDDPLRVTVESITEFAKEGYRQSMNISQCLFDTSLISGDLDVKEDDETNNNNNSNDDNSNDTAAESERDKYRKQQHEKLHEQVAQYRQERKTKKNSDSMTLT